MKMTFLKGIYPIRKLGMKKKKSLMRFIIFMALLIGLQLMSGCFLMRLIPAPKRSFLPQDLLIAPEDLPPGLKVVSGPDKTGDHDKPPDSMEISIVKSINEPLPNDMQCEVREFIYIHYSIENAKYDYGLDASFPGETNIASWTFMSKLADEQKFSCYTYSNVDYPVCTWVARYEEIEIQVIGWLIPNRVTLDELQNLIRIMDEKIVIKLSS
jgi:hypothetical protein